MFAGQNGVAVKLQGPEIELSEIRFKENNFDVVVSDKISLDRNLNDMRNADCMKIKYDNELPSVSVIIIFYNEPRKCRKLNLTFVIYHFEISGRWFLYSNAKKNDLEPSKNFLFSGFKIVWCK